MLADRGAPQPESAGLITGLHRAGTQFLKLIEFIAKCLPKWRDDRKRKPAVVEDDLSDQFCAYLNVEARKLPGIESFSFQREKRDDANPKGKLDIAAMPDGDWLKIGPRSYSIYDTFLPIECKRLPMPEPKNKKRDHREYLYDQHKSAGGVQRFKAGHHGANHSIGAMIGYIQSGKTNEWLTQINGWVAEIANNGADGWSSEDSLTLDEHDIGSRCAALSSNHERAGNLSSLQMRHLWVEM